MDPHKEGSPSLADGSGVRHRVARRSCTLPAGDKQLIWAANQDVAAAVTQSCAGWIICPLDLDRRLGRARVVNGLPDGAQPGGFPRPARPDQILPHGLARVRIAGSMFAL